jgi:hypothetical protein
VIEDLLKGAASLFGIMSTPTAPPNRNNSANVYTNSKYNSALSNRNNQITHNTPKLQLAVDSDSDESVDVPDSSDDECSQTQSVVSQRILHK